MVVSPSELVDILLNNNKNGHYHIGKMFLDMMKIKPPNDIFQIDAATGEEATNGFILAKSVKLAKAFRSFGLKPGDVLALGGNNHLDLHVPYYAAMMEGLSVVGVDPYYNHDEMKNLFTLAEPKIAFGQDKSKELYERSALDLGISTKVVTFDGDYSLTTFIAEYGDDEDIDKYIPAEYDTERVYAWLLSTSGTTGLPKIAAFKHRVIIDTILRGCKTIASTKIEKPRLYLNTSPPQWISAFYVTLSLPVFGSIKLQSSAPENLGHLIDIINKYRPSSTMLNPSTMALLLKHEKPCDLTCFNMITLTSAKVYKELYLSLKARLRPDCLLMEAYAQSETIGAVIMPNPFGPIGSCGVFVPGLLREVKLVNPDDGTEITAPNVTGELWVRGNSFTEYYRNPKATAEAFTADGWFKSGDLLYRDEANNYFYVDRIKLLIRYRNFNMNPNEIEEVITKLAGVVEVCVVAIPHPEDSQRPAACVVREDGSITEQQVRDIVAENLPDSKQLRGGVLFLESLPKTSTGKVARVKVAALARDLLK